MAQRFTSKTRWHDKLHKDQPLKLVPPSAASAKRLGAGLLLIPRPIDVDAIIRKVRKGRLVTVGQIRQRLAADFNELDRTSRVACMAGSKAASKGDSRAASACPLCTGIFVRISAEAAEEDRQAGRKAIAPYWRVVRDDGSLYEKFPGGSASQAAKLRGEGHRIVASRGESRKVQDFQERLAKL